MPLSEATRRLLSTTITIVLAAIVVWGVAAGEPAERSRAEELGSRIKCPVCQGESITDSPSGFARDMLAFVEEKVDEGWTDDEIIGYLEARFPGTRLDPGFDGAGLALWVLPVGAVLVGLGLARSRTAGRSAP